MDFTLKLELNIIGYRNADSKLIVSLKSESTAPSSVSSIAAAEKSAVNLIHIPLELISPPRALYFTPKAFGISLNDQKLHHIVSCMDSIFHLFCLTSKTYLSV